MRGIKRARALTERIDIQQQDAAEVWDTVLERLWAELIPVTGKEFQAAESTRPAATVRWRVRYMPALARMDTRVTRVKHGDDLYNVTYIEDAKNAHVELYIVGERVDP